MRPTTFLKSEEISKMNKCPINEIHRQMYYFGQKILNCWISTTPPSYQLLAYLSTSGTHLIILQRYFLWKLILYVPAIWGAEHVFQIRGGYLLNLNTKTYFFWGGVRETALCGRGVPFPIAFFLQFNIKTVTFEKSKKCTLKYKNKLAKARFETSSKSWRMR